MTILECPEEEERPKNNFNIFKDKTNTKHTRLNIKILSKSIVINILSEIINIFDNEFRY